MSFLLNPYLGSGGGGGGGGGSTNAVNFDGSTYLQRSGGITGTADSKLWLFSCFFKPTAVGSLTRVLFDSNPDSGGARATVRMQNGSGLQILASNADGDVVLNASKSSVFSVGTMYHLAFSIDLANAANRFVYLNQAAQAMTWLTYTNQEIDFTVSNYGINYTAPNSGDSLLGFEGEMGHFLCAPGQSLDLSVAGNLDNFITAGGAAVSGGVDGSLFTGTQPLIYYSGEAADWADNKGSGEDFSITGTITDTSTALQI